MQDCRSMHLDTMEAQTASLQPHTGLRRRARLTRRPLVNRRARGFMAGDCGDVNSVWSWGCQLLGGPLGTEGRDVTTSSTSQTATTLSLSFCKHRQFNSEHSN